MYISHRFHGAKGIFQSSTLAAFQFNSGVTRDELLCTQLQQVASLYGVPAAYGLHCGKCPVQCSTAALQ